MNDEPSAIGISREGDSLYVAPVGKKGRQYFYPLEYWGSHCRSLQSAKRSASRWARRLGLTEIVALNVDLKRIEMHKLIAES